MRARLGELVLDAVSVAMVVVVVVLLGLASAEGASYKLID